MAELLSTHMLACGVLWLEARAVSMPMRHHATMLQAFVPGLCVGRSWVSDTLPRADAEKGTGCERAKLTLTAVETCAGSSADH
jgi:hypothetical protein